MPLPFSARVIASFRKHKQQNLSLAISLHKLLWQWCLAPHWILKLLDPVIISKDLYKIIISIRYSTIRYSSWNMGNCGNSRLKSDYLKYDPRKLDGSLINLHNWQVRWWKLGKQYASQLHSFPSKLEILNNLISYLLQQIRFCSQIPSSGKKCIIILQPHYMLM